MKAAFIIGDPIKHSRSPLIHSYWIKKYGLDASYEATHVIPSALSEFEATIRNGGFEGGNVTLPHKQAIIRHADTVSETARAIGAANTIIWDRNSQTIHADNTDAYGFTANLDSEAPAWRKGKSALVLGAGGAARAIIYALVQAGFQTIMIANRTRESAVDLALMAPDNCRIVAWDTPSDAVATADLIINTTSLGMIGQPSLELSLSRTKQSAIVTDIVYAPLETSLLAEAKARGLTSVDGLGMLLHQAVPGFQEWFGIRPDVDAGLRDHIVSDLTRPA